jgi:hypothetical protein
MLPALRPDQLATTPDLLIRHPHDLSGTMKTAVSTCFVGRHVHVPHARTLRSRAALRAQRAVYICKSTNTDSGNSNTRAAAMAAAFVMVSHCMLVKLPTQDNAPP